MGVSNSQRMWSVVSLLALFVAAASFASAVELSIIATGYSDPSCANVTIKPRVLNSGWCLQSPQFQFYTVLQQANDSARFLFGCENCSVLTCSLKAVGRFGDCQRVGEGLYAKAAPGAPDDMLLVESGRCEYLQRSEHGPGESFMVAYIDASDAPVSKRVALWTGCDQGCKNCLFYNETAVEQCMQIPDGTPATWLKVSLQDLGAGGFAWEEAFIVSTSVGGSLILLLLIICSCVLFGQRNTFIGVRLFLGTGREYAPVNHA